MGVSALAMSCSGGLGCSHGEQRQRGPAMGATAGQGEVNHAHAASATAATAAGDAAAPAAFANTKCPIMGSPINPSRVAEGLTRVYNGEKIAFCCGGCPGQWDKLTDAQKDARLR
jgi:hypothetical protein